MHQMHLSLELTVAGKRCRVSQYIRAPKNSRRLCGENEDQCIGGNGTGSHMRWIGEW